MQSEDIEFRPPKTAIALLSVLAVLVAAQPAALLLATYVDQGWIVSFTTYWKALTFTTPISVAIGVWIGKHHVIRIADQDVMLRSTRYGLPKERTIEFKDISHLSYRPGIFGSDGRPRPLLEFALRSGSTYWTSLAIYRKKDIESILSALQSRGIHLN